MVAKIDIIMKGAQECKDFADSNAMGIFEKVVLELTNELGYIRKEEERMSKAVIVGENAPKMSIEEKQAMQ